MSFNPFNSASQTAGVTLDQGLRAHMIRVFNYMGLGVGLTGLVAWLIATQPALMHIFYAVNETGRVAPTLLGFIAIFSPLVYIFVMNYAAMRASLSTLQLMFWGFCSLMGISMATVFMIYTGESIASTFFVTAGTFAATALYGYTTKTDLTKFGSFLIMGVIGIVLASLVNIFLHSSALQFAISVAGVLIFTGMTAWDTQNIKHSYAEGYGTEANGKMAISGALSLYLNFINLFQFLLSFMGRSRN